MKEGHDETSGGGSKEVSQKMIYMSKRRKM